MGGRKIWSALISLADCEFELAPACWAARRDAERAKMLRQHNSASFAGLVPLSPEDRCTSCVNKEGVKKSTTPVILSKAKDLWSLPSMKGEMLRCAQHDRFEFFHTLKPFTIPGVR